MCYSHEILTLLSVQIPLQSIQFLAFISLKSILILSSHLLLGFPKGLFPVGVPVNILKALIPSSILATCPAYLNFLDLITLTTLGEL